MNRCSATAGACAGSVSQQHAVSSSPADRHSMPRQTAVSSSRTDRHSMPRQTVPLTPMPPLLFAWAHRCLCTLQAWSSATFVGFVVAFNCLPAALELLTFLFVARVSFFAY